MTEQIQSAPIDWTALIAAIFAGINGVLMTFFYLRGKSRQESTDQEMKMIKLRAELAATNSAFARQHAENASQHALRTEAKVEESKRERTVQIEDVKGQVGALKAKVEEGIIVSNNYNAKIAEAASATRKVAEQVRQIAEFQSHHKP